MPGSTQAIGMACVFVGMAVGRGHIARILRAFSALRYARHDFRADRGTGMSERDSDFRIKPGRVRSTRAPRTKSFVNQVLAAAQRAGHTAGGARVGKSGRRPGHSTFGRGRNVFGRSRIFSSQRRVVIKARIARHQG
ncbi:MAG: hypothetical protein ACK5BX_02950, partial [Bradyrhizobium sp.]